MTAADFPPALCMLAGAPLLALLRGRALAAWAVLLPLLALVQAWRLLTHDAPLHIEFWDLRLTPVRAHAASGAFAVAFCLAAAAGLVFAAGRASRAELCSAACYAGGALGVCFAGDLLSLLVFLEVMMLAATVIIWCGGTGAGRAAGMRYFVLHALGGMCMLIGVVLIATARISTGDPDPLALRSLTAALQPWPGLTLESAGAALVLGAMLLCAAAPPLSAWVADAYPEASGTGAVFLSAFTTKTAVFCMLVNFAGIEALVWIGVAMTLYGVLYAVLENDIRRLLAYSIVSQVGFMVVGVGLGTALALDGAAAHAAAHIFYKALLFLCAAVVVERTGTRLLSEMGGLWRAMPLTAICCLIGALSMSAFPLTSGFTTKGMIDEAVARQAAALDAAGEPATAMLVTWVLLEIAAAGVFLCAGIKLPWFVFFGRHRGTLPTGSGRAARIPMIALAALCLALGVYPAPLYALLPHQAEAWAYEKVVYGAAHVAHMLGLLAFAGLVFFVQMPLLRRKHSITLDIDWFWRAFPRRARQELVDPFIEQWGPALRDARAWLRRQLTPPESSRGLFTEMLRNVAGPVFVVLLMLVIYLALFLLAPVA